MANIDRIFSPSYVPSRQDILNARVRTTGIAEEVFHFGGCIYHVFDVGGKRSERKKWIHVWRRKADIVIFQVPLGEYDSVGEDDETVGNATSLMIYVPPFS
jgi:guanine nucleotide-binding protein subunit alpha